MVVAERVRVDAPGGGYDIVIEPGLLRSLGARAGEFGLRHRTSVVTNTTLALLYGVRLAGDLPNGRLVTMPDGEQYKTLETVAKLYADFVTVGLDRGGTVIALGGGVVGDTVGFAAATYLRGVRLVQIPTSLLAMVDSSVGGKVGVDLPQGKNLVGAFKQPDVVLIDPDVLHTLPEREWRCGMAELVKHGLLADPILLNMASRGAQENATDLVRRAIQVKVDVVQADPYEKGQRAILNLGHTFAHAIEQVTNYQWLHGEAVSVGLVGSLRLSHALGMCGADLPSMVEGLLTSLGLPVKMGELDPEALYIAMATDKKWLAGKSRFILLRAVGKPEIVEDVDKAQVIKVLEGLI